MKNVIASAAIAALSLTAVQPAFAQSTAADIAAACLVSEASCSAAIALLQASGATTAEINSTLGAAAATLVSTASANSNLSAPVATALRVVAGGSSDAEQQSSLLEVASVVAEGDAGSIDTGTAFGFASGN